MQLLKGIREVHPPPPPIPWWLGNMICLRVSFHVENVNMSCSLQPLSVHSLPKMEDITSYPLYQSSAISWMCGCRNGKGGALKKLTLLFWLPQFRSWIIVELPLLACAWNLLVTLSSQNDVLFEFCQIFRFCPNSTGHLLHCGQCAAIFPQWNGVFCAEWPIECLRVVLHGNRRWWHRSEYCSCAFLVCGCVEDDSEVMMGVYIENVFFFFGKKKLLGTSG